MIHKSSYNFRVKILKFCNRKHRHFAAFQSRPCPFCISSRPSCVSTDSIDSLLSRNTRIMIFRARRLFLSPFFSIYPISGYVSTPPRVRSLHIRETRYHVRPNNFVHAFDSSMFRLRGESVVRKKWSLGLRYLLIAVTSTPNCTPKPETLLRLHPSLFLLFSFLSSSCPNHVDLDFVSLCRILRPTDHSYESYLVAFSTSSDSK